MKEHHEKLLRINFKIFVLLLVFCLIVFIALGVWWIAFPVALFLTVVIHYLNYDVIKLLTGKK